MSSPPIHAWVGEQSDRRLDVEFDGHRIRVYRQERYRDGLPDPDAGERKQVGLGAQGLGAVDGRPMIGSLQWMKNGS